MSAHPKRVESEFDASGADIDTRLAELLGTTVDLEDQPVDDQSNEGSTNDSQDEGDEPQRAEPSGAATAAKRSRRGRSAARLERRVDDAVRSIVDNYEFTKQEPLYGSIAVVSALPGEGVTTIADGLARVLARDFDTTVCVVDTHTDRPGRGIYELLTEDAELDDVLTDEDDGVFRLALGEVPASARNSWFRSAEWVDLVSELTSEFGHCIFDMAPMLARGNTLTLLRHVDAHVLVARYGATSAAQVKAVAGQLRNHSSLGSVLNGHQTKTPQFIRRFFSE